MHDDEEVPPQHVSRRSRYAGVSASLYVMKPNRVQDPELRAKFDGKPEHVVNFMFMVAEEVRVEKLQYEEKNS